jgi:putative phage-type endonuclease
MTLTAEQHQARSAGIGSSEIAAVVGVSPFQTVHDVWMRKRGLTVFDGNLATRMGSMIEDAIIHEYEHMMRANGEPHETANFRTTFQHPDEPWIVASPDRLVFGKRRLVEAKNVGFRSMFDWGTKPDELPDSYRCQVEWQMGVCDAVSRLGMTSEPEPMETHVVAWIGGCDMRVYRVSRDLRLWNALVSQARTFWFDNVLANVAPEIDGSEGAKRMVNTLFRESWKPFERATEAETELVLALREAKKTTERAEEREEELRSRIKSQLGHREGLIGEGWKVTWKTQKDGKRPFKVQDIAVKESNR